MSPWLGVIVVWAVAVICFVAGAVWASQPRNWKGDE